jgi:hypothetical protein
MSKLYLCSIVTESLYLGCKIYLLLLDNNAILSLEAI